MPTLTPKARSLLWKTPQGFALSHCMNCALSWTRSGKEGSKLTICLLDREPVLDDMTERGEAGQDWRAASAAFTPWRPLATDTAQKSKEDARDQFRAATDGVRRRKGKSTGAGAGLTPPRGPPRPRRGQGKGKPFKPR
jgi:hypothetical protein